MARVVDANPGSSPVISWASYADGRAHELYRGEDFHQVAKLARRAAISWSLRHGLHAKTQVLDEDTLIVRFVK